MILAVVNAIFATAYVEAWKTKDLNEVWTRVLALLAQRSDQLSYMEPLTFGIGHLWFLTSPWGMNVKLYIKYFIYWTAVGPNVISNGCADLKC